MPQSSSFVQPTKTRFRACTVKGVNLLQQCIGMSVYESIFKPYKTATLTILDNNSIIQNMKLVGKEPAAIAFDGGQGEVYADTLYVLNVKGEKSNKSLRSMLYTIDLIGPSYYHDKGSLVQQAFQGIPGTQAIQLIHGQYVGFDAPLRILEQSIGLLSKESFISSSIKPFKAINDIRSRLNFAMSKSGNCLYFRDVNSYVLAPLEALFSSLSAQQTFVQRATWGANWYDIVAAENAIISAIAQVDHSEGGSAAQGDISAAASQEKTVFDWRTKTDAVVKMASQIGLGQLAGALNGLAGAIAFGSHGGLPNYQTMDSAHNDVQTDRSDKTEAERVYAAAAKDGAKWTIKVPIQSGINCTVGKGIFCRLLPAMGDQDQAILAASGGLMLVTDLCHELYAGDKTVNGTTIFQTMKGGLNA